MPRIIGVRLTGTLSGWASPKDVILKWPNYSHGEGRYKYHYRIFGQVPRLFPLPGKATICNMGAEVGATTSIFPYDERMATYLKATEENRWPIGQRRWRETFAPTEEVTAQRGKYYDRVIEINLSELETASTDLLRPMRYAYLRICREGTGKRLSA